VILVRQSTSERARSWRRMPDRHACFRPTAAFRQKAPPRRQNIWNVTGSGGLIGAPAERQRLCRRAEPSRAWPELSNHTVPRAHGVDLHSILADLNTCTTSDVAMRCSDMTITTGTFERRPDGR
jgi:hypothetical protein